MPERRARIRWEDVAMTAAGEIRQKGAGRLDLDALAETLDVAPEAVRYWFPDETELLLSIMQIRQRWFIDEAEARMLPLATHTEKLGVLIDLCAADHDMTYWIELWKRGLRDERARQARQTLSDGYRDLFARLIRAGERSGEFDTAVAPDRVALVLVALVCGLAVECTTSESPQVDAMHDALAGTAESMLGISLSD